MLYVGLGKTVFAELLGNFHITNYWEDRMGLYQYNYTVGTDSDSVLLHLGTSPIKVSVQTDTLV